MKKIIILTAFLAVSFTLNAQNVLWEFKFTKQEEANFSKMLVLKDLSIEFMDDKARLREIGDGTEGTIVGTIKYLPAMKFIQIKMGIAETADNSFYLYNSQKKYKLFTGWNTFPVNEKNIEDGSLKIVIIHTGPAGSKPGGWADIKNIRVVNKPVDGLTIESIPKTKTVIVGSSLCFKYFSGSKLTENKLYAHCFVAPEMAEYRFSQHPIILNKSTEKAEDNIYSCNLKIDDNAFCFKSGGEKYIQVMLHAGGSNSYTVISSFDLDIATKFKVPKTVFKGANPDIIQYRKLWQDYTKGNNLALGKKFVFSKTPDYRLTRKGDTDTTDLTDGKLSSRKSDTIWFDSAAVGWYMSGAVNGVNCLLDLGEIKPVGDVVIRALGGGCQRNLISPRKFSVFVSKDNKNFYEAASMQKLMPGEKTQSDFKSHYYIDEFGRAYVYPFRFTVNADARYIGIQIIGATNAVFVDEVAVLEAKPSSKDDSRFNTAYKDSPQPFYTEGIIVAPRIGCLALASNINLPNSFLITDMRAKEYAKKDAVLLIELPESAKIIIPETTKEPIEINGEKYIRWRTPFKRLGGYRSIQTPMFFISPGNEDINGKPAYFSVECEGVKPIKVKVPIQVVKVPVVTPEFKRLHIGLAWMGVGYALRWPDFFKAWKTLGFNSVSCFPRGWKNTVTEDKKRFFEEAKKNGMSVVMNESPFHVMMKGHKPGSEIFSQTSKPNRNACPSYRGKFYQKEMQRVADNVALSKPDYVFWDIECWYRGAREAHKCKRCVEWKKKTGKDLKELGTEMMKDLKEAVKKGSAGGKMPIVGSYNHHATHPVHHLIMDFNRFYPDHVDLAMPSLYVVGRALDVHNSIRKNYEHIKRKEIIPWLSAGCYGEFDPFKIEPMVLEALMNGANGITYYCYTDFDNPLDFYYQATALAAVAPYENLIVDGEILTELMGSNNNLTYSAIKKGNEMLLLIGNYKRSINRNSKIKLPFSDNINVKELINYGKWSVTGNTLEVNVPEDKIVLLHITGN